MLEKCAKTVKKTSMELGGNAAFIVFESADVSEAARNAAASKFRNSGQVIVYKFYILDHQGGVFISLKGQISEIVPQRGSNPSKVLSNEIRKPNDHCWNGDKHVIVLYLDFVGLCSDQQNFSTRFSL